MDKMKLNIQLFASQTILSEQRSTYGSPYAYYTVLVETSGRTASTTDIKVTVKGHLQYSSSTFGTGYTLTAGIYLNGSWYDFVIKNSSTVWSGTTVHTTETTFTVPTSVSASSITNVSFRVLRESSSGTSCRLNSTSCSDITLPVQPITPVTNVSGYIGSDTTISISPNYDGFNHTVIMTLGSISKSVDIAAGIRAVQYTISTDFYSAIPNSQNGIGSVTVVTKNGSTEIGRSTGGILSVNVNPSTNEPNLTLSVVDNNSVTTNLTRNPNVFIPRYSTGIATISASSKNSASLSKVYIDANNKTYNVSVSGSSVSTTVDLGTMTSGTINAYATDSRQIRKRETLNKTVIDYADLSADFTFTRPTPTGDKMQYIMEGIYWSGNFGDSSNSLTMQWRVREYPSGTFSGWQNVAYTLNGSGTTKTIYSGTTQGSKEQVEISNPVDTNGKWDYQKAYEFEIRIQDALNNKTITKRVSKGKPIYNWYEKNDENYFNVNGKFLINGQFPVRNIFSGTLLGGNSITLPDDITENSKLIVHARCNNVQDMTFIMDLYQNSSGNQQYVYGGNYNIAWDESSAADYYFIECRYTRETRAFDIPRTGFITITNQQYSPRLNNSSYFVYQIDVFE